MKNILVLISCCLIAVSLTAQSNISGTVVSNSSGKPLPGATVTVQGTYVAAVTNEQGMFSINNFSNGSYVLEVRFVGYATYRKLIDFSNTAQLKIALEIDPIIGDEVVISATRATQESGMAFSDISAKDLEVVNTGRDIPFLLENVPSLVATSDAGTGIGYTGIRLRGSDASRINVTIDGIPMNDSESQLLYWVNMPDLASSVSSIQVQRGVGTSTNGAGAFGGSVNIQTSKLSDSSYAMSSNAIGSFNTLKHNVALGSGMINGRWNFEGRLSKISSDGFIDRATSDLKSFFVSGGYFGKKDRLKLNIFSGKEITYQSWYGVPEAVLDTNRTWNYYTYDNQVDNYQQDHYQLFYTHEIQQGFYLNTALHYNYGRGYFEEFKEGESFADYNLDDVIVGNDTIQKTNLIRRKWLDNNFYGLTWSLNHNIKETVNFILGGAWNQYDGDHFGEVIWAQFSSNSNIRHKYYENNGLKTDFNVFFKSTITIYDKLSFFGDLQYRTVDYNFSGIGDDLTVEPQSEKLNFFNPKAGITYTMNPGTYGYLSFSVGNKEPSRDDYTESTESSRPNPERLYDLESGYYFRKNNFMAGFNYFLMMYDNQLVLTGQINDVGNYTRTNIKKSFREGLEIEGGWIPFSNLSIKGNVTFSRSEIKEYSEYVDDFDNGGQLLQIYTNTDIAFSPKVTGFLDLSFKPFSAMQFSLINRYIGEQYLDNTANTSRKLDAWFTQDFRLSWTFKSKILRELQIAATVGNILNEKYESNGYTFSYISGGEKVTENYYYPQAGRNYMLQLTVKF
ncbi:MAG: TonB-dependent receptor [Bacteroidetes bacterium]|nr:TonB-dependent receptor [Bacteroidota bacterium]